MNESLPRSWHGTWRGMLTLSPPPKGFPPAVPMALRVTTAGDFSIIYDGKERPYVISAVPGEPNRFQLDEKNGIVLDGFLDGNTLHFAFDLDETRLITRYTLEKSQLRYEVRTYKASKTMQPEGATNKIISLRHASVQSATLRKSR